MDIDGLLVLSFGGPEGPDEVMPFLRKVTAGRGIPDERLSQVRSQYDYFGGVSPLNATNRDLVSRLASSPQAGGLGPRIYLANRNSAPFVADVVAQMAGDGVTRAAVFITSAFSSYAGCRLYRENLTDATEPFRGSIEWQVLPRFHDHPLFTAIWADRLAAARPTSADRVIFVTHSLPAAGASRYVQQHEEVARAVIGAVAPQLDWRLAFQSRSGPPSQPWLEPDIADALAATAQAGAERAIVAPIGFCGDNLEIRWDLDVTATAVAADLGIKMLRLDPPQSDPRFVEMVWDLLATGIGNSCAVDCCPNPIAPRTAVGDRVAR